MQKLIVLITILFGSLIGLIIYRANTGTGLPFMQSIRSVDHGDKVAHFLLFGTMAFLLSFALRLRCVRMGRVSVYRGSAWVAAFAIAEEFSQHYLSNRSFELLDLLADAAGIFVFSCATFAASKLPVRKTMF